MLNFTTIGRTATAGALLLALLVLSSGRTEARPPYKKLYQKTYPKLDKTEGIKISCKVCHPVKDKKMRNNYGAALRIELGVTDRKKWEKDLAKVTAALQRLEGKKSHVKDKTFGDLIKEGKLPGENKPAKAKE